MRCAAKDSYPGCYDISSAGHIPAGAEFVGSALRELREELGDDRRPADLHECGLRRFRFEAEFHGKPFKDNQVSKVFCLWLDREAEDFAVQKSEIDYVKWFDLDEAVAAVDEGTIPNCIFPEELGMVKEVCGGRPEAAADAECGLGEGTLPCCVYAKGGCTERPLVPQAAADVPAAERTAP